MKSSRLILNELPRPRFPRVRSIAAVGLLFALSGLTAVAQDTRGMIFGTIVDPTSATVPNATVTIVNLDTNVSTVYKSNETGYYEANLLIAGRYRVLAEAPGFKRSLRDGIDLTVGTRVKVDLALSVGDTAETISVTADAPLLETTATSSGAVLSTRMIQDLPNPAFAVTALGLLTPGTNSRYSLGDSTFALHSGGATGNYFTAGNVGGNEWSIDGTPNNGGGRGIAYNPVPEVVQEMKVETSGFDASLGHSTGVNMSVMTRSGTNAFHGALREAHRQARWQAMRLFQKQAYYTKIAQAEAAGNSALANSLRNTPGLPSGRLNSFAASLGGPVVIPKLYDGKNRLFFFFGYAGFRQRFPEFVQATLPTMANRQGDFSNLLAVNPGLYQIYDPLTVAPDPARPGHYVRGLFPGNIIPASRVANPTYKFFRDMLPVPNTDVPANLDPVRNFSSNLPVDQNYTSYSNRFDFNQSNANRFFGRWSYNRWDSLNSGWQYFSPMDGIGNMVQGRANTGVTIDWVRTFGPATVLDVAVAGNQYTNENYPSTLRGYRSFKPSEVGLPSYLDAKAGPDPVLPVMNWAGYSIVALSARNAQRYRTSTVRADLSHVRGNHSLRAGTDIRLQYFTQVNPGQTSGQYQFSNFFTQRTEDGFTPAGSLGHSWAAFMMGIPSGVSIPTNDSIALMNPYYSAYVQDNWRVGRRLSLSLGLRMEYELGVSERYNRMIGYMDKAAKLPITDAAVAAYARSPIPELSASQFTALGGSLYPGVGGRDRRLWQGQLMWLPRVAVAYELNSKTVLRGGYGVFYDTLNALNQGTSVDQSFYNRNTNSIITNDFGQTWLLGNPGSGVSPLTDPFPVRSDGTRFDAPLRDSLGLMAKVGRGWTYNPYERLHARQQRWRAGIQRQFGSVWVVDVAYAGSYSNDVAVNQTRSYLPANFWATGQTRNNDIASNLNANVPNPFFIGNFSQLQAADPLLHNDMRLNGFFTRTLVPKNSLLRAFPHMNGLSEAVPIGAVKTHSLETMVQRRFAKGLSLSASYVRLKNDTADFFFNEFDPSPTWRQSNVGMPNRLAGSGVYELPFGRGRNFARSGLLNHLLGGFQISLIYEYQTGPLIDWGNLFYSGDVSAIPKSNPTFGEWFNTANFERNAARGPAAFHARVFPTRIDGARWQSINNWNSSLQRDFRLKEGMSLQFRGDFMNLQNRSQLAGPVTNPFSTDFGKVVANTFLEGGEGGASNRWIQVMVRLQF